MSFSRMHSVPMVELIVPVQLWMIWPSILNFSFHHSTFSLLCSSLLSFAIIPSFSGLLLHALFFAMEPSFPDLPFSHHPTQMSTQMSATGISPYFHCSTTLKLQQDIQVYFSSYFPWSRIMLLDYVFFICRFSSLVLHSKQNLSFSLSSISLCAEKITGHPSHMGNIILYIYAPKNSGTCPENWQNQNLSSPWHQLWA